jgi:hypothetical protein
MDRLKPQALLFHLRTRTAQVPCPWHERRQLFAPKAKVGIRRHGMKLTAQVFGQDSIGEAGPTADNATDAGRTANRRTELVVVKK